MVSTATTVTPSSTPSNTTIINAGVGPSPAQGAHYITQQPGGQTQTYHIFLPTSQGQVGPYFSPGGLLQAATAAMPQYHVAAAPTNPYFTNFTINPGMIPTNSDFFQANVKSSNRGGHNNYKGRGRGRGGGNNDRNTPGANSNSSQASYNSGYYNPNGGQQQFSNYGGSQGGYKGNGNRNNHSNNWETSSQHSNSSQKKFSSSSGSSVHEGVTLSGVTSPPGPRIVHHGHNPGHNAHIANAYQQPQQSSHSQPQYQPRHQAPVLKQETPEFTGAVNPYHYHNTATVQSKEFVNKRGRGGGRGGSSRGRDDMTGGYNSVPRGGGHPAGNGGPPQRNQTMYHQPRHGHNSGGMQGQVPGPGQEQPQQPGPEPPRPAPEFNMKANDFPSLPGVQDPTPASEPSRFLDVVKGTAKMKLDDDQETLPDDFLQDDVDEPRSVVTEKASEAASVSPRPRSKNSSVSETPVVSVERSGMSPTDPAGVLEDGLVSPPLVNGDVKGDRDSGSISPRQQSMVSDERQNGLIIGFNVLFRMHLVRSSPTLKSFRKRKRKRQRRQQREQLRKLKKNRQSLQSKVRRQGNNLHMRSI